MGNYPILAFLGFVFLAGLLLTVAYTVQALNPGHKVLGTLLWLVATCLFGAAGSLLVFVVLFGVRNL